MAFGRDAVETGDPDSSEAEALLNETWLSAQEDGRSASPESMTARTKAPWSTKTPVANTSDDGAELHLESLRDSHDLDSAQLRAQGHEAALQRSFSPLAAIGLGFRYTVPLRCLFMTDLLSQYHQLLGRIFE